MSYEEREGYGITRPRTIKTPDGTWNFYPKKGKAQPPAGPPVEQEQQQSEQGGGYDPYSEYGGGGGYDQGGYGGGYEGSTGGIMSDVDIAGFGEAFNIFGSGSRRRRR